MTLNMLKPWTRTPFELLSHAEEHRRGGTDFDKRVALVGFDNSIEVSVITYLGLNPIQRGGRSFEKAKVEYWKRNFHTKLEFLEGHALDLAVPMDIGRAELVYYHELRNDLYHSGNGFVPAAEHLEAIRRAAIWTFSLLFDCDADEILDSYMKLALQEPLASVFDGHPAVPKSEITTFLHAFLTAKKTVDTYIELHGNKSDSSDLVDAVREASHADPGHDIPSTPDLMEALVQADHVKNLILRGEPPDSDSANLESLSKMLDALAGSLKPKLQAHHQEIALRAVQATLIAKEGDGRAGVVLQTAGSGITLSLLAYLALCRTHPALSELPVVVVTDTHAMMHQFLHAYHHLQDGDECEPIREVQSGEELSDVFAARPARLVVTTVQKLVRATAPLENQCLVVGYNLRGMLSKGVFAFSKGIFLLFASVYSHKYSDIPNIFGEVVFDYSYREAKEDGYLLPVRVVRMRLDGVPYAKSDTVDIACGIRRSIFAPEAEVIARAVIQDMTEAPRTFAHKAIVLVPDISSGSAVVAAMGYVQHGDVSRANNGVAVRACLISSQMDSRERESLLSDFQNSDGPAVAVMTIAWVVGLDFPAVDRCFVTRSISPAICSAVVSLVGRLYPGKTEGVVVDLSENVWPILVDE
ncbi:hypothetical protein [Burkholderia ubonensis]|uniref:hypothetical protein n=1 Tax=Burkholderia ubonensis TaxID=101571 RepID=UPI000AA3A675|nr:hypothetical protein [Burkholderia ubonensis]